MTKNEFIKELSAQLASLPQSEIEKSIAYYSEVIDDRLEDGMTEPEAVAAIGSIPTIVENIMYDMSIPTLMKARVAKSKKKASNRGIWLTLVILGFPLWFPLLVTFFAVTLTLYLVSWTIILSLYAVILALGLSGIVCFFGGIVFCVIRTLPFGLCVIGGALCCAAVTLFLIIPIMMITKWLIKLTALFAHKMKSAFITREGNV